MAKPVSCCVHVHGLGSLVYLNLHGHGKIQVRGDRNPVGAVVAVARWRHCQIPAHSAGPRGRSVGLDLEVPLAAVLDKLPDGGDSGVAVSDHPDVSGVSPIRVKCVVGGEEPSHHKWHRFSQLPQE